MMKSLLATVMMGGVLLASAGAHAALMYTGSIGGAPSGVSYETFNELPLGAAGGALASGISVSFNQDGAAVQNASNGFYAAPVLSGSNGAAFGQGPGVDTTTYLASGSSGAFALASVTITLPAIEQYFGLLWGSVDAFNTLTFLAADGTTVVGTLTGSQVLAGANGDQGVNGTLYVNINSDVGFKSVRATSSRYAFEIDNVAFNPTPTSVPEPLSLSLLGAGLLGIGIIRRKRAWSTS